MTDAPVLLACDGSTTARLAVATAARLFDGRPVVAVAIWTPAPAFQPGDAFGEYHGIPAFTKEGLDERRRRHAEETAQEAHALAERAGIRSRTMVLNSSDVAHTLVNLAECSTSRRSSSARTTTASSKCCRSGG